MEAAGRICLTIEAKLSPGPPILNLRRHGIIVVGMSSVFLLQVAILAISLQQSTYEVAAACVLIVEADKLICIVDGWIYDEQGRLARFMSLEDADLLIRKRAKKSEIAAKYVKDVGKEDDSCAGYFVSDGSSSSWNANGFLQRYKATFQNGVGFDNGNGLWSGGRGFAIGGEDRLSRSNGYLSELAAAAFVCRGGVQRVHILVEPCS